MRAWVRRHRWIVHGLVAALVASQMAASAYACPDLRPVPPVAQASHHAPDCASHVRQGLDPAQPLLCKAHCEAGQQSVNSAAGPAGVPPPVLLVDARWARVLDVAEATVEAASSRPELQPVGPPDGTPPLYLSLLVLRN